VTLLTRTLQRATILVADDDPTMLRVVAMILNRSGYRVLTAQDGKVALKAFEEAPHAIQLVISDVFMPGMKGPQLVHSIIRISPSIATLLMSGTPIIMSDDVAVVTKPFTREALVSRVQNLLAACDFARIEREQSAARSRRLVAIAGVNSDNKRNG
jgi:two-component system cell cycle sensor histidine kinase/response regulator CckA